MGATGNGTAGPRRPTPEMIPREFLRIIAIWSLIPSYLVAGGLIGWTVDRWLDTFPYLLGACLVGALALAVRDMRRLTAEFFGGK